MSTGETLTLNMTTDELKKLIRDEIAEVITDRPTKQDVKAMVKSEVDTALSPILHALDGIKDGLQNFDTRWNNTDRQLDLLVQKVDNMTEAVRDVKDEQKRIDDEQDELKRGLARMESKMIEQSGKLDSQERAIFGDVTRPGTKSLFDHISELGETLASEMGRGFKDIQLAREIDRQEISRIQETAETIRADVEANKQFRERRQQIEKAIIQSIPKAGNRLWEGMTSEIVIKAVKWGLIPIGLSIIAALLERLQ